MCTNVYFILQIRAAMLGEGHIRIFGTLQIGHTNTMDNSVCSAGLFPTGRTMDITVKTLSSHARQGWNGLC